MALYSHWFALGLLIFSFLLLIDAGSMRRLWPEVYSQVLAVSSGGPDTQKLRVLLGSEGTYAMKVLLDSDEDLQAVIQAPGLLWIVSMAALRVIFTFTWLIVAWGAFRELAGVSRSAAIRSLALFLGMVSLAILVAGFFQMAPIMVDTGRWLRKWWY